MRLQRDSIRSVRTYEQRTHTFIPIHTRIGLNFLLVRHQNGWALSERETFFHFKEITICINRHIIVYICTKDCKRIGLSRRVHAKAYSTFHRNNKILRDSRHSLYIHDIHTYIHTGCYLLSLSLLLLGFPGILFLFCLNKFHYFFLINSKLQLQTVPNMRHLQSFSRICLTFIILMWSQKQEYQNQRRE